MAGRDVQSDFWLCQPLILVHPGRPNSTWKPPHGIIGGWCLSTAPQQVPDGSLLSGVDVAGQQNPQPQEGGQMERVMAVVTVFQAVVLGDRRGIDQIEGRTPALAVRAPASTG